MHYLAIIIVIPLFLGIGVAAPFIADSFDRRRQRGGQSSAVGRSRLSGISCARLLIPSLGKMR
jgi:hypothetical protein